MNNTFSKSYNDLNDALSNISNLSDNDLISLYHNAISAKYEYEDLQLTVKANCNSLYGSFGNKYFDLFDCDIAEDITTTGKHIAITVDIAINKFFSNWANNENLSIINEYYPDVTSLKNFAYIPDTENDICIYGDTDSRYIDISIVYELIGKNLPQNTKEGNKELIDFSIFLNNRFLKFIIEKAINDDLFKHGGNPGYLIMEHEVVTRKSVFLKKKNYIKSMIWKDGKTLDDTELDYMGVSIKRGETNPILKNIIKKLIWKFLVEDLSIADIKIECVKIKRYIMNKKKKSLICRSTSVSGVNDVYQKDGKWCIAKNHLQAQLIVNWLNFIDENDLKDTYQPAFESQKMTYYKTLSEKYSYIGVPDDVDIDDVKNLPEPDWNLMFDNQFMKPLLKCIVPGQSAIDPKDFLSNVIVNKINL